MGYYMCYGLFIWVSMFALVSSYGGPTVGIFTQCGDGTGYNKLVSNEKETTVLIDSSSFYPEDSLSCTVVFKAEDSAEHLYYKVKSYTMYSQDSEIKIETKSYDNYRKLESFTLSSSPNYGIEKRAWRYIRITVTRGSLYNEHFYMSLQLYTDEYWSDLHNIVKITVGTIIGIVAAIIAVIIIIIILCVCCICKAGKRRSHKGIVVTTDTRNAHIDIPEIGTPRAYPYAPPAENFAIHPGYPTAYPPTAYPPQPYGQPPPPYTDAAFTKSSAPSY